MMTENPPSSACAGSTGGSGAIEDRRSDPLRRRAADFDAWRSEARMFSQRLNDEVADLLTALSQVRQASRNRLEAPAARPPEQPVVTRREPEPTRTPAGVDSADPEQDRFAALKARLSRQLSSSEGRTSEPAGNAATVSNTPAAGGEEKKS